MSWFTLLILFFMLMNPRQSPELQKADKCHTFRDNFADACLLEGRFSSLPVWTVFARRGAKA